MEISRLFDIRISKKLPILFMVISAVSVVSVGVFSVFNTSASLMHQEEQTLVALAEARNSALQDYVKSIEEDILISAGNGYVQSAMSSFALGFQDEESRHGDPLKSLHGVYINDPTAEATNASGNPEKIGEKHLYNGPEIEGSYHSDHRSFHPWFRQMLEGRGYYDIFLVDVEGNVVYTVFKELDYATNLNNGKYKDSGLAQAFKAAMNNQKSGSISFIDFAPYAPSYGAPASFMSTPIVSTNGLQGVLIFQMPIDRINGVLQQQAGMGESGETYIVGSDYLMRSDSRFSETSTILKTEVKTETVTKALNGEVGIEIVPDYRGINVLSAYQPLDIHGVRWALLAEIDEEEVLIPSRDAGFYILMIGLGVLVLVALLGWYFARSISSPIRQSTSEMLMLANGDKSFDVSGLGRADEIGDMASALQTFKENAIK